MEPFTRVTGVAAPLDRADVDTDQIIPKQFLKRVERTGYGPFLFHGWRYRDDGSEAPGFVLNRPSYREARVLIAGPNFGCGSSREHAAWALRDFGIRTVIAPSFADIFRSNCFQNGMLPVALEPDVVSRLLDRIEAEPGRTLTVDLEALEVRDGEDDEVLARFEVDPFRRRCLLSGWDEIALTLQREDRIRDHEEAAGK